MQKGGIQIYRTDKDLEIQVKLDNESVWLDAQSIGKVFDVNRPAIVKHINNVYKAKELSKDSTCSILEQVAADGKKRKMNLYNLDIIISVGYRVNSKQATRFRQWATHRLKDHLVKGYTINQERLDQLRQTIQLIEKSGKSESLSPLEAKGLLEIISNYTQSFVLLNRFDNQTLKAEKLNENVTYAIKYDEASRPSQNLKNN